MRWVYAVLLLIAPIIVAALNSIIQMMITNIAVAMIELESDAFDTHEYLKSVKDMKSDSFARYYEEYSKKFTL